MNNLFLKFKNQGVYPSLILIIAIWINFGLQQLGAFRGCYGVIAWQVRGLKGILLSPLFHSNLNHLVSNTLSLFVLTLLLFLFYQKRAYWVLLLGWLLSGLLLWLLPDFQSFGTTINNCHIGASGLIYMLASFLFWGGIFSRQVVLILLSIAIAFVYGSLVYGVFPHLVDAGVSWQGHLMGAIVGGILGYLFNRKPKDQRQGVTS